MPIFRTLNGSSLYIYCVDAVFKMFYFT